MPVLGATEDVVSAVWGLVDGYCIFLAYKQLVCFLFPCGTTRVGFLFGVF